MTTIEQAWADRTQPTPDGHLIWTGSTARDGQPALHHQGRTYSPYRIAWRIKHGQEPQGIVRVTCKQPLCLTHLADTATRARHHTAVRAITGYAAPSGECRNGHDRHKYGRLSADGIAYCLECQRLSKQRSRARKATA